MISPLGNQINSLVDIQKKFIESEGNVAEPGFGEFLSKSFEEVNTNLLSADRKVTELAVGKSENLHEAMLAFEKAESAFKLLTQVRNKAVDAYQEILKMQV
jgi:flagellar hook-basal body complex protein FliE